jgi:formiminotetrahydrofolate cyclodeaminase
MVDTRSAMIAPLLERPLGQLLDALADGDDALGDGPLAAVAAATSAGRLVAACTDLLERPEGAPHIFELASLLARTRGLRQQLNTLVNEVATAELDLADARGLPSRDAGAQTSQRSAVQVALKRVLDRRLAVANIAAELVRLARDADTLSGGEQAIALGLAETLASAALSSALAAAEREVHADEEPWLREYVGSEIVQLRRRAQVLVRRPLGLSPSLATRTIAASL